MKSAQTLSFGSNEKINDNNVEKTQETQDSFHESDKLNELKKN